MEKRKHFLDYLANIFMVFGVTVTIIAALNVIVGEEAKGFSTMFELGSGSIPVKTLFQFLLSSLYVIFMRFIFFTDILFKRLSEAVRTVGMFLSVIIMIAVFAYLFGWFPIDDLRCWIMCMVSFAICFVISVSLSFLKERSENRRLEAGLRNLKEAGDGNNDRG